MILAAGLGVRMLPLTALVAKPVLPVLNRPLLHWTLERLRRSGVRDVLINTHYLPRSVRRAVADGRALGLRVTWSHEREILGTGGGPRAARRFFGDSEALLVNGDAWFDFDLRALLRRHRESGALATLALRPNPDPERYGPVVTGPRGVIRSLAGLPQPAAGTLSLFTGVHILEPAILERLGPGPSDSVRDLYAPLVGEGERLLGVRVRGAWYDFGVPSSYLASQMTLLRGLRGRGRNLLDPQASVEPGARVESAVVGARARVARGAHVRGSVLWDGVVVEPGARVERSVLATGVRVMAGERIVDQVVTTRERQAL
jgi:NDP-sugar pyrophosphorylase family protein